MAGKYNESNLIPAFILAAEFRNKLLGMGFTDNGGAIHSSERIINMLGLALNYPDLDHLNNIRHHKAAKFSVEAKKTYDNKEKVYIEHVSPVRDFTREAIKLIDTVSSVEEKSELLKEFVRTHYQLVLLTKEETDRLNRLNRTKMSATRLFDAGIELHRK